MADPLSVVASSIGVLGLTLQTTGVTYDLVKSLRYPEKTHKQLMEVLIDLQVVLKRAGDTYLSDQLKPSPASDMLARQLNDLNKLLVKLLPRLRKDQNFSRVRLLFESRSLDAQIKRLRQGVSLLHETVGVVTLGQIAEVNENLQRQNEELSRLLARFPLPLQRDLQRPRQGSRSKSNIQEALEIQDLGSIEESEMIVNQLSQIDFESKHLFHVSQTPKNSGQWILADPEYVGWLKSTRTIGSSRNWLWLNGLPGSGKTTLTSVVIDDLLLSSRKDTNIAFAFFYFDYTATLTIQDVVLVIIKQLCLCLPSPISLPEEVIQVHHLIRLGRTPTLGSLVDTLSRVCARFQRTILAFDGLDEFTGPGLLNFLHMLKDVPCKIFAASRYAPQFKELFSGSPHIKTHVDSDDITLFTSQMLESNPDIRDMMDDKLVEEVNETFVKYHESTFLLPVLQMQHLLEQTSTWEIRQCLKEIPKSLEALYRRTVQRVLLQSESRSRLARRVLIWVAYAKRPLSILEIQHALAVSSDEPSINTEKFPPPSIVKAACFNLVSIDPRSSIVLLSHYSFQNYLEVYKDELFGNSPDRDVIQRACLDYLHLDEFKAGPCESAKDLEERLNKYPLARYAATHWGSKQRSIDSTKIDRRITDLLRSPLNLMAAAQIYFSEQSHFLFSTEKLETFSPLHWASFFGLTEELRRLLDANIDALNKQDPFMRTPLHWAIEKDQQAVVELLVEKGADASILDRNKANALHVAAQYGSDTCLQQILHVVEAKDFLQKNENDQTPLQIAAIHGSAEMVKILLTSMSVLDVTKDAVAAALEDAVSNGRADIVELLLERNNPDPKELRAAARYGSEDVARILLEHGVDVNGVDSTGVAAIHEASASGKIDMIHFLLDNNADINATDADGCTPLHYAVKQSNRLVVELLLRQGADQNHQCRSGETAFGTAVRKNDTEMATLLQFYGAHISLDPDEYSEFLSTAIKNGNEAIVRMLLEVSEPSWDIPGGQRDLLHAATAVGKTEIVRRLLEAGLDVNKREDGETAIMIAKRTHNKDIETLLLDNGARLDRDKPPQLSIRAGISNAEFRFRRASTRMTITEPVNARNVCVGIHYETHFLQACFGMGENLDEFTMIDWLGPGLDRRNPYYLPTRIAYPEQNPGKITKIRWGFDVDSSLKSFPSSKSFLDLETPGRLKQEKAHEGLFHAEPEDLCADFLSQVRQYIRDFMIDVVGDQSVTFCFTVPAMWPPAVVSSFRKIIAGAGFNDDRIKFVTESEAAALIILKQLDAKNIEPIKDGECFTICQCGDVTVDLTTYILEKRLPRLTFSEACAGTGGLCGFDLVQNEFEKWMETTFDESYTSLPMSLRGPGSSFALEFEALKNQLDEIEQDGPETYLLHLPMSCSGHELFLEEEKYVQLNRPVLEGFFKPSIDMIIQLIESQIYDTAARTNRQSQNIFLTGSFASSKYLHRRLRERFYSQGISVLLPPKSSDAAVMGAALYAATSETKETNLIASRISRRHFGVSVSTEFQEGIDDGVKSYIEPVTGRRMCTKMHWFLARGDKIPTANLHLLTLPTSTQPKGKLEIFTSASDPPPVYRDDPSVMPITMVEFDMPEKLQKESAIKRSRMGKPVAMVKLVVDVKIDANHLKVKVIEASSSEELGRADTSLSI